MKIFAAILLVVTIAAHASTNDNTVWELTGTKPVENIPQLTACQYTQHGNPAIKMIIAVTGDCPAVVVIPPKSPMI